MHPVLLMLLIHCRFSWMCSRSIRWTFFRCISSGHVRGPYRLRERVTTCQASKLSVHTLFLMAWVSHFFPNGRALTDSQLVEKITSTKNINMNYINYENAIQQKHHVSLVGWPSAVPFYNPSKISLFALLLLLCSSLVIGSCSWQAMSKRQERDHADKLAKATKDGKVIGWKRKVCSDKGSRKKKDMKRRTEVRDDDEEAESDMINNEGDEEEGESEQEDDISLPKKRKTTLIPTNQGDKQSVKESRTTSRRQEKNGKKGKDGMSKRRGKNTAKAGQTCKLTKDVSKLLPPTYKSQQFIEDSDEIEDSEWHHFLPLFAHPLAKPFFASNRLITYIIPLYHLVTLSLASYIHQCCLYQYMPYCHITSPGFNILALNYIFKLRQLFPI